jgi:hypothetical protein
MQTETLIPEIALEFPLDQARSASDHLPQSMPGDVIVFAGQADLYSKFSRWLMRTRGEEPTYAVHTAQFLDANKYLELDLVGKIRPTRDILRKHQKRDMWQRRGFEVWRLNDLTVEQREAVTQQALTYLGARFGWAKFVTHLLDGLLNKLIGREAFFFRRLNHDQRYPICSWITSFSYDRALHYQFGVSPECADPDELADWVNTHPNEWTCVYRLADYM